MLRELSIGGQDLRLLVTGGAGFIGSNFTRNFFKGFYTGISSITVLDKLTYAGVPENLIGLESFSNYHFVKGDICDSKLLDKLILDVDAVINFAAESHVDRSIGSSTEFVVTNIMGVQVILDSILKNRPVVKFIQISTDEVYGSIVSGSWDEDHPIEPNSPYSASKAAGEMLARAYHKTHGLDVRITRCSNNFGPYQFPEKLISLSITNLLQGIGIPIYGGGGNIRDWVHVDDHCEAVVKVLHHGQPGEVYNVGGGEEFTNLEIAKLILKEMELDESKIRFVEDRKGHDFRYSVDTSKIRSELGFSPKVGFHEGIKQTIDWYRANENWWKPLKSKI